MNRFDRAKNYYHKHGLLVTIVRIIKGGLLYLYFILSSCMHRALPEVYWIRRYKKLFNNHVLILDHGLGGGTNKFRETLCHDLLIQGKRVVVLSCIIDADVHICYRFSFYEEGKKKCINIYSIKILTQLLRNVSCEQIIYNNLVYFTDIFAILSSLKARLDQRDISFKIYLHDYFSICPSYTLINAQGEYCGVPEYKVCVGCQKQLTLPHFFSSVDINKWREEWGELYERADKLICFSHSAIKITRRAYPKLDVKKFIVKPHSMSYFQPAVLPRYARGSGIHIGVVGSISSVAKGLNVVRELAGFLSQKQCQVRLTVIGSVLGKKLSNVKYIGEYSISDLAGIIERSGVNIILFPSICPETFSYLVSELILLRAPIVCFAYGAQEEKVAKYKRGKISRSKDPEKLYNTIKEHYINIYGDEK